MTEEEAIQVFLDYLKKAGRGRWEGNKGPDPPDFIIVNPERNELAAVEHTRFYWPPQDLTFHEALQSVKRDVNRHIKSGVQGLFAVSIEHDNREAFLQSFRALPRAKQRGVSKWLAQQIETTGMEMAVGEETLLDGPLRCKLRRYSESGPGEMIWVQWKSVGRDLGIRVLAKVDEGTIHVERLNGLDTVLGELERVLARKAEHLKAIDYGRRLLIVEYYASSRQSLEYIIVVLNVPQTIDELYFLVFPGLEVVRWQGGRLDGGA